jgi:hypothetical protein
VEDDGRDGNDGRAAKRGCEKAGRLTGVTRGAEKPPPRAKPPDPRADAVSIETRHEEPSATSAEAVRIEVRVMALSSVKLRCENSHLLFGRADREVGFVTEVTGDVVVPIRIRKRPDAMSDVNEAHTSATARRAQ